jgi:hypothetical protein
MNMCDNTPLFSSVLQESFITICAWVHGHSHGVGGCYEPKRRVNAGGRVGGASRGTNQNPLRVDLWVVGPHGGDFGGLRHHGAGVNEGLGLGWLNIRDWREVAIW